MLERLMAPMVALTLCFTTCPATSAPGTSVASRCREEAR